MRARQGTRIRKLLAARQFIHENADRLPITSACPVLRELDELLVGLRCSCERQVEHRLGGMSETQRYHALRETLLLDHIKPIVAVARLRYHRMPEFAPFAMPRGNPSAMQLPAFARGMAQAANKHADVFVAAGLEPDFDARLAEAVDAMVASAVQQRTRSGGRVSSTVGIDRALRKANDVVTLLTVFVRRDAVADATVLDAWRAVALPRALQRLAAPAMKALPAAAESLAAARAESDLHHIRGGRHADDPASGATASTSTFFGGVTRLLRHARTATEANDIRA